MLNFEQPFFKILEELCDEMDIELSEYSFRFFRQLKKDNKIRNIFLYKFDLNSAVSTEIANDKYATFEFLKANNVPIIDHHMIFNPKTRKDYVSILDIQIAKKLYDDYNGKIVIKANSSLQGKEVYYIENREDIEKTIDDVFSRDNDSLSICPFEEVKNEYRMVVLDNQCLFGYKKVLPKVIGDGRKSVADFVAELNIEKPDKSLDFSYIPKEGEEFFLNWKFNLSGGAIPCSIDDLEKKAKLEKIATDATRVINIRFATVDIIENKNGEFKVMEINASVCMNKFCNKYENGYEIAKDIYRKAIERMFE